MAEAVTMAERLSRVHGMPVDHSQDGKSYQQAGERCFAADCRP